MKDINAQDIDLIVEVDFCENQRYKPIRGWGKPYQFVPNHSDLSMKVPLDYKLVLDNAVFLPRGWEWTSQWKVDTAERYGKTDADGWSYGTSFDSVLQQTLDRKLKAERNSINVVRRRRWMRFRKCVDSEAMKKETIKREWLQANLQKIADVTVFNTFALEKLSEYDTEWRNSTKKIFQATDFLLSDSINNFENIKNKLLALKHFLLERGTIEAEYANRLSALSGKWSQFDPSSNSFSPVRSEKRKSRRWSGKETFITADPDLSNIVDLPKDEISYLNPNDLQARKPDNKFFEVISTSNKSTSNCVTFYSRLLSDSIPQGMQTIILLILSLLSSERKLIYDVQNRCRLCCRRYSSSN